MLVRNAFTNDSRVEREAATLVDAGCAVTVVCHAGPGLPTVENRDGYVVVRVARSAQRLPGLRFASYRRRLLAALRAARPQILHAHDTDALEPVASTARQLGIPFVYDAHELWLARPRRGRSGLYHWLGTRYYAAIERRFMARAAATMVANPPVAGHLARIYGIPEPRPVPNYPQLREAGPRSELRSLPGGEAIDSNRRTVLFIGGIMANRGIEQLVTAMGDLPELQLVFLGSGGHQPVVAALAESLGMAQRTHFLAPVPPLEVIGYARSADIGVSVLTADNLNNRYSLPNKLFQCMAAGLPVVASDFPQVRAVLDATNGGGAAGILVDTGRPAEIRAALATLRDDPARSRRMGAAGRRAFEERFNWTISAQVLRDIYAGVWAASADARNGGC